MIEPVWSIRNVKPWEPCPFAGMTLMLEDVEGEMLAAPLASNATWSDAQRAAEELVRRSGDTHHVFIEAIELDESRPGAAMVVTGS